MNNPLSIQFKSLLRLGSVRLILALSVLAIVSSAFLVGTDKVGAQETELVRVGERFTYTVRVEGFTNAGFADLHVASEGKFRNADVFEVNLKLKTFEIVNAAFFSLNETRTAFVSKSSGMPQGVRRVVDGEGFPAKSDSDYFDRAPSGLDLITIIYKLRQAKGEGEFRLTEGGKNYWVVANAKQGGRVRTEAGDFETIESDLRSEFFTELGLSDVKLLLSSDALRVPVLMEFGTRFGKVSVRLVSMTMPTAAKPAEAAPKPTPAPVPSASPRPPAAKPTPVPYVENRPLGDDVPFKLGERVAYRVRNGSEPVGVIQLEARERKRFEGKDGLFLVATVTEASPSAAIFRKDDQMKVWVDPGSFLPMSVDVKFNGSLSAINYTAKFDQVAGSATPNAGAPVTVPVGTHSLLSLIYAIRTFNLKQSSVAANPVNDTRVSVFWNGAPLVFTIRPSATQTISVNGSTVKAQPVDVITGDPQVDALKIRVWLSDDSSRTPVKLTAGSFSAELISPISPARR